MKKGGREEREGGREEWISLFSRLAREIIRPELFGHPVLAFFYLCCFFFFLTEEVHSLPLPCHPRQEGKQGRRRGGACMARRGREKSKEGARRRLLRLQFLGFTV